MVLARGASGEYFLLMLVSCCSLAASHPVIVPLEDSHSWTVHNPDTGITARAHVPGGVYASLQRAQVLSGATIAGFNDVEHRWVSRLDWQFSRGFQLPRRKEARQESSCRLEVDGVDTVAAVAVNGHTVGHTNNQFVGYRFSLDPALLKWGRELNYINITIRSPIEYAGEQYRLQTSHAYLVPPKCPPPEQHGECHVNHVRKMQSSFSWDWGPAVPDLAVWRPLRLRCFSALNIDGVAVDTRPFSQLPAPADGVFWTLQLRLLLSPPAARLRVQYTVHVPGLVEEAGSFFVHEEGEDLEDSAEDRVVTLGPFRTRGPLTDQMLWWPNGEHGHPRLHRLTLCWHVTGNGDTGSNQCKLMKIGFRQVRLIEKPVGNGTTFMFAVNGRRLFIKGSNWVPADMLSARAQDRDWVTRLLGATRSVHMNMLRVWGGGVYESDMFYRTADRLGIMIWQDAMFACSMYPSAGAVGEQFTDSVRREMSTQLWRLQRHPSVVVWAANNENEAALRQNWFGTSVNFERYRRDYVALYVDTLQRMHGKVYAGEGVFLTSSPSNGRQGSGPSAGYIAADPQSEQAGDMHHYDYSSDLWRPAVYPVPRFASEYGVQAWPSLLTLAAAAAAPSRDLHLGSHFLRHRQHHPLGDAQLLHQLKQHFRLPEPLHSQASLGVLVYLSQVHQAHAVRVQTEHYRRGASTLDPSGRGCTMGAMFWQLNDVWAAPTWSAVDHTGRWKLLMHAALHFFRPLLLSLHVQDHNLHAHGVSDLFQAVSARLTVTMLSWSQFDSSRTWYNSTVVIPPASSTHLWSSPDALLDTDRFLVRATLTADTTGEVLTQADLLPPNGFHTVKLRVASVHVAAVSPLCLPCGRRKQRRFLVRLGSDAPAAFVSLESRLDGVFSDNGFHMMKREEDVIFTAEQESDEVEVADSIIVTSLMDVYQNKAGTQDPRGSHTQSRNTTENKHKNSI